jgi:DNA-binding response OmpR family regulator
MGSPKILLIEDDAFIIEIIEACLSDNFDVLSVRDGVEGLDAAVGRKPDLIILDIMLPGMNGFDICTQIRSHEELSMIPILFLTAKNREEDRIRGFQAGGDDYLGKPFSLEELLLRVKALLRRAGLNLHDNNRYPAFEMANRNMQMELLRSSTHAGQARHDEDFFLVSGDYILNTRSFELVTPHRGKIRLTPVQFKLLLHLMSHPWETFNTRQLLESVWEYPPQTGAPDLVRVQIKKLRERIEEDPRSPRFLRTIKGSGYTVSPSTD